MLRWANIAHNHSLKTEFLQSMKTQNEQKQTFLFFSFLAWDFCNLLILLFLLLQSHTSTGSWKTSLTQCFMFVSWKGHAQWTGRAVGRTKVSGISPDQITSHSISYTEKVAMENLCKALNAFREISILHNYFLI